MRTGPPVALAVAVLLAGCGTSAPGGPPAVTVDIRANAFNPPDISIHRGDTVAWTWHDGVVPHNVDGASDLNDFSSGAAQVSGVWRHRFTKTGTFSYHCDVHPAMTGTVTVS